MSMLPDSDAVDGARRRWLRVLPAAGLLALGAAQAQPRYQPVRLALGGQLTLYYLPLILADRLGYFRDEGLAVQLLDTAGGGLAKQALVQGRADVVAGAYEHTVHLRQQGRDCQAFAAFGRAPQLVFGVGTLALREAGVGTAPGALHWLQGRRVGMTALDSATHWFARMVLARAGVSPDDVQWVPLGVAGEELLQALRKGRVDALAHVDPVVSVLEQRAEIRVLADARSLRGTQEVYDGPMPGGCLYADQDFILRRPRVVQGLTNALVRALKWLQTAGPSDLVHTVPAAYMGSDRGLYLAALEKSREAFSPDGLLHEQGVLTAHRMMARQGLPDMRVARLAAPASSYTNEFVLRARQKYAA